MILTNRIRILSIDYKSNIYIDISKDKRVLKRRNFFSLLDLFFSNKSYYPESLEKYDEDLDSIKIN